MKITENPLPNRRLFRRSITAVMIGLMVATGSLTGLIFAQQVYDDPDQQSKAKLPDVNAQGADTTDVRVARISLINDHISFQRGDDEEWYDATLNTPVQAGDRLYTGDQGRLELQLDGIFLRLDKQTGLDVIDLSTHTYQFRLFAGTATVKVNTLPQQPFEIDTPNGAITILRAGNYRINVRENGSSDVVVTEGGAEVYNNDTRVTVHQSERMEIEGGGSNYYDITELPKKDEWDVWNDQRNDLLAQAQSPKYVEKQVAGVEDLDHYGKWVNTPEYGNAWQPEVSSDWAPYQDGQWTWRDPYGWSWVSNEPWGWAPYHYGRWAHVGARWCWVPFGLGFYSPALVGFLGFGGGGFIGWVPLAPYEIFTPWWRVGRGYYIGNRRYNSAFYVNNFYFNQRYRHCVTVFPRDGFIGGGRFGGYRGTFLRDGYGPSRPILANSILPTRRSLALGPIRNNFNRDPHTIIFNRTVIAKNNSAPVVSRFSDNLHGIRAGGGMPVSQFQTTSGGARVTRTIHVNNTTSFSTGRDNNSSTGDRGPGFVRRNDGNRNNGSSQVPRSTDRSTNGREDRPMRAIDRPFVPPSNNRPGTPANNGSGGNDVRQNRRDDVRPQTNNQPSRTMDRARDDRSSVRPTTPTRDARMEQRPTRPATPPQPHTEYRPSRPQSPPPRSESRPQTRPSNTPSRSESRGSSRPSSSSSSSHSSGGSSHSGGSSGRSSGGGGRRGN